jgi:hypothetical protein
MLTTPMRVALPVAALGFVLALAQRQRLGVLLGILALVSASALANMPDTRLWNARVLPFFYLSVYLLAALTLALVAQLCAAALTERADRPDRGVLLAAPVLGLAATLVAVGLPLRALPFGEVRADGSYQWMMFSSRAANYVPAWAKWNYSGYEAKPDYAEYRGIVDAMDTLGRQRGCGRASWEYDSTLNRYGTPMALMLLPFWTDGCIGSMEGLYFESSGTTPFHFLNSSLLSQNPSRPQRDLPYRSFDAGQGFDLGVRQLQTMGVRYYMAMSDASIAAARAHPALTEVAGSPPWVVFEVAGSELAESVSNLPVVVAGATVANAVQADRFRTGWLGEAVRLFNDPTAPAGILPAEDGPADWPRVQTVSETDARPVDPVQVSQITSGTDRISFRVDRTGVPVLVKASYFPNWKVSGAEGPWRVGPNMMAVVPTSDHVVLSYGTTGVERLGWMLTFAGIAGVLLLSRRDRHRPGPAGPGPHARPPHRVPADLEPESNPRGPVEVVAVDRPVSAGLPVLSIVMPAFNEEADLADAVTEVVAGLRLRGLDFELTVVENGSTDRTVAVAEAVARTLPEVSVLSLPEPDYGCALRVGLLHARGTYVANFDVDYFDLDFLDSALARLGVADGPAVVVGSKRGEGAVDTRAWYRRLVTAAYVSALRLGFGLTLSDTHGIKAMRREPLVEVARTCRYGRDLFDTELVLRAERAGLPTSEIPVTVIERRASRTSILRRLPRTIRGLVSLRGTLRQEERAGGQQRRHATAGGESPGRERRGRSPEGPVGAPRVGSVGSGVSAGSGTAAS